MITKQQYLDALETIDLYHKQNEKQCLTLIQHWDKFDQCSYRLQNVLRAIIAGFQNKYTEQYIEKIDIKKMLLVRNCGVKTRNEFVELRGY